MPRKSAFEKACEKAEAMRDRISQADALYLYGRYKRATSRVDPEPVGVFSWPTIDNYKKKAFWDCRHLSRTKAKQEYVAKVNELST